MLALAGCASNPDLVPVSDSGSQAGVIEQVDGVEVAVRADAWKGDPDIRRHVTPIRVEIRNRGERPVRIGYGRFSLVTSAGRALGAIPPLEVKGSETDRRVVADTTIDPAFAYSGFHAAPYYYGYYSGVPIYAGDFYFDSFYYDAYDTYWIDTELPTVGMIARALPEGILKPGGTVSGFLYFEPLPDDATGRVTFRADLISADSGKVFGEVSIPYRIRRS